MVTPPSLSPISQNMNSCFVNRQHINQLSTFAGATVSEPSTIQQQSFLATVRRLSPLTKVRNKAQQERLVKSVLLLSNYGLFQFTRPMRGVTLTDDVADGTVIVSTHTPRAGRDIVIKLLLVSLIVSTHTPRTGRDCCYQDSFFHHGFSTINCEKKFIITYIVVD